MTDAHVFDSVCGQTYFWQKDRLHFCDVSSTTVLRGIRAAPLVAADMLVSQVYERLESDARRKCPRATTGACCATCAPDAKQDVRGIDQTRPERASDLLGSRHVATSWIAAKGLVDLSMEAAGLGLGGEESTRTACR